MQERETLKERLEALVGEMVERGILFEDACAAFERHFIEAVMRRTGRNLSRAADELRIHRNTLRKRVREIDAERSPSTQSVSPASFAPNGTVSGGAKRPSGTKRASSASASRGTAKGGAKAGKKPATRAAGRAKTQKLPK